MEARSIEGGPSRLRLLLLSDLRVQNIQDVLSWVRELEPRPDLILYAGDDLSRFVTGDANYFELLADETAYGLFAIAGNDDTPEQKRYICGRRVYDAHACPTLLGLFAIIGSEGAPLAEEGPNPGFLLYSEQDIAAHLHRQLESQEEKVVIVVSHAPPAGSLDRAIRYSSREIGSRALAEVVGEVHAIKLVVCGHVHLHGGRTSALAQAVIANAASHDSWGAEARAGLVEVTAEGGVGDVEWQAVPADGPAGKLMRVPGLGYKAANRLLAVGIGDVATLVSHSAGELRRFVPGYSWPRLLARAQAQHADRVVLIERPKLPQRPHLYIDLETELRPKQLVWLIGCYHSEEDAFFQFFAERPDDERRMLEEFLAFLERYPGIGMLHYSGNRFDQREMEARLVAHDLPIPEPLASSKDVKTIVGRSVGLPLSNLGLKEVASWLGYDFKHPDMDGLAVASTYLRCVAEEVDVPYELLEYNQDDVLALQHVVRWMEELM